MAASEVEICKLAQSKIGNTNFFSSLNDATVEAMVCSVEYPQVRDVTFEVVKPQFAVKRVIPGLLTETRTGWLYAYGFTAPDYLCILGTSSELGRFTAFDQRDQYDVEMAADNSGRIFLTNIEAAEIIYISRVSAVGLWPPSFTDAVVYGLAATLALSLKKDPKLAALLNDMYYLKIGEASSRSQNQRNLGPEPTSAILRSRE